MSEPWAPMSDPRPHATGGGTWGRKGKFLHWPPFSPLFLLPNASPEQFSLWMGGLKSSPRILNAPSQMGRAWAGGAGPSLPREEVVCSRFTTPGSLEGARLSAPTAANSAPAFIISTRCSRLPQPSSAHTAEPPAARTLLPVIV